MSMSLQEQLLKAGLVNEKQVKQANKQKQKETKLQQKGQLIKEDIADLSIKHAQAEKIAKDKELNRQQQEKVQRKAIAAQIKELIIKNRLPRLDTEDYYNFVDYKKVKRIAVNDMIREKLTKGNLAIVSHEGYYELIPRDVALKIQERNPQRIVVLNEIQETVDDNDPYKDFVVPDDLMW